MENVIVIGSDHHNTLGVIRAFGYKGIKVTLILYHSKSPSFVKHSRFIERTILVNDVEDAIVFLLKEKKNIKHTVVIGCGDRISLALDKHYDELSDTYSLPGTNGRGNLSHYVSKMNMSELGRKVGFNVPTSWLVETPNDVNSVVFPCITKPIVSIDGEKSDIKICNNRNELISVINNGIAHRFQVQKYIEKKFEYQVIGLSLNAGDELIVPGVSHCLRPCPATNTGFLHYVPLSEVNPPLDLCKKFVQEVGYSGLFSIEFIRDKGGKDYFLEMNYRNDGNAICVTASGVNLPYLWALANNGGDYHLELKKSRMTPVYVMPEIADFKHFVLTRKISFSQWIKDLKRTDKLMEFDRKDPIPFFIELYVIVKHAIKKVVRKKS